MVALLGPRQIGKTTLANRIARESRGAASVFDLENPRDLAKLADPMLALEGRKGLVVLDEIQRRPEIFPVLRVLADRPGGARFLVLGSASPDLLKQSSETLAGRIAFHELTGFSLAEVGSRNLDRLWLRGRFPLSYTARSLAQSGTWRRDFIRTFLERDLPGLGVTVASTTLQRFWSMLAHLHGGVLNSSELARSFGVSDNTIRHYLEVLVDTYVVRLLRPWHENISKRQVKAPKVFVADTGLLHTLLDIESRADLDGHPKLGASWQSFLLEQVVERLGARRDQCYFWATHSGAELDLLVVKGRARHGFEFKRTSAPSVTPSMRSALTDIKLDSLDVIYPGDDTFALAPRTRAVASTRILEDLRPL